MPFLTHSISSAAQSAALSPLRVWLRGCLHSPSARKSPHPVPLCPDSANRPDSANQCPALAKAPSVTPRLIPRPLAARFSEVLLSRGQSLLEPEKSRRSDSGHAGKPRVRLAPVVPTGTAAPLQTARGTGPTSRRINRTVRFQIEASAPDRNRPILPSPSSWQPSARQPWPAFPSSSWGRPSPGRQRPVSPPSIAPLLRSALRSTRSSADEPRSA